MKLKIKLLFVLLAAIAFSYTGCKKLNDGSSQTLSTKAVSSQIALNLSQTLYNGFGVFSISEGINAPSELGISRKKIGLSLNKGKKISDLGDDITCGLVVDTTLNYSAVMDDNTQATIAGRIKFTFLCSDGVASGFNVFDDLNVSETSAQFAATYKLGENLTLQSLNPQDVYADVTLNGTLNMSANLQYKTGSKQTVSEAYNYNFKALTINNYGDINAGTATFSTKGSNASGVWNYEGSIVFLGNNQVKITINGTVYVVDLQTGQIIG